MTQRPPGGAPVFPRATSHCSVPPPTLSERCPTPPWCLLPALEVGCCPLTCLKTLL